MQGLFHGTKVRTQPGQTKFQGRKLHTCKNVGFDTPLCPAILSVPSHHLLKEGIRLKAENLSSPRTLPLKNVRPDPFSSSMNQRQYLKATLPGPYTFILPASSEVPRMVIEHKVGTKQRLFSEIRHPTLSTAPLVSSHVPTHAALFTRLWCFLIVWIITDASKVVEATGDWRADSRCKQRKRPSL